MISLVVVVGLALAFLRPLLARLAGARGDPSNGGAAIAVTLVMCAATLAIWVGNPFAAALVVPALNLWMWVIAPDMRLARPSGSRSCWLQLPPAAGCDLLRGDPREGPIGLAWTSVLMLAGGQLSPLLALEWSLLLGCAASASDDRIACGPPGSSGRSAGHRSWPGDVRGAGLARRNGVGAQAMRRVVRDISSVLILSGLLLVLDAGVTLVWQEPVTAAIALIKQSEINNRFLGLSRHP